MALLFYTYGHGIARFLRACGVRVRMLPGSLPRRRVAATCRITTFTWRNTFAREHPPPAHMLAWRTVGVTRCAVHGSCWQRPARMAHCAAHARMWLWQRLVGGRAAWHAVVVTPVRNACAKPRHAFQLWGRRRHIHTAPRHTEAWSRCVRRGVCAAVCAYVCARARSKRHAGCSHEGLNPGPPHNTPPLSHHPPPPCQSYAVRPPPLMIRWRRVETEMKIRRRCRGMLRAAKCGARA